MKGASLEEKIISFEYESEECLPETSLDQLEVLTEAVDRLRLERRIWASPVCRWYLDQRKAGESRRRRREMRTEPEAHQPQCQGEEISIKETEEEQPGRWGKPGEDSVSSWL